MSKRQYSPCVDCEKGPWYAGRGCGCQDFCKELEAYKGAERMLEEKQDIAEKIAVETVERFNRQGILYRLSPDGAIDYFSIDDKVKGDAIIREIEAKYKEAD